MTQTILTENVTCLDSVKELLMKIGTNVFGKEIIVVMNKINILNNKNFWSGLVAKKERITV